MNFGTLKKKFKKEETTKDIQKYIKMNEEGNITYKISWAVMKAEFKWKIYGNS